MEPGFLANADFSEVPTIGITLFLVALYQDNDRDGPEARSQEACTVPGSRTLSEFAV